VDAYLHHYTNEEFFLSVIIVCLILSCILAMLGFFQLEKVQKLVSALLLILLPFMFCFINAYIKIREEMLDYLPTNGANIFRVYGDSITVSIICCIFCN
jgi:Mn2+/Fe2+ NRAMP family transporter